MKDVTMETVAIDNHIRPGLHDVDYQRWESEVYG